jgi:hypothetical protein
MRYTSVSDVGWKADNDDRNGEGWRVMSGGGVYAGESMVVFKMSD